MGWTKVFENPLEQSGELLTYAAIRQGAKVKGGWTISQASPKRIVIYSPGSEKYGARFAGKKYTFTWDGTGYKRQGQYLYVEGSY